METTKIPLLPGAHRYLNGFTSASRHLLADGIHSPESLATRIGAGIVNLLCHCEPRRFQAAALDVIEELSRVSQSASTLYVVIYGTKRTFFAAKLIASGQLARHIKLVLTERELAGGPLTIPRMFLYQVDTDRYPFTDSL